MTARDDPNRPVAGSPLELRMRSMRYVTGIPRKPLPAGRVLVHNFVRPQRRVGWNGFRAWTEPLGPYLVLCGCDWAGVDLRGLAHYRVDHDVAQATFKGQRHGDGGRA